jgi:hypothetical protein
MKQEQEDMQAEFWYKVQLYGGGTAIVVIGLLTMWFLIDFAFNFKK